MYCKKCGRENRDEARFCKYCGEPLGTFSETNLKSLENTQATGIYETYEDDEKKSHKGILVTLLILVFVIFIGIGGAFVYDMFLKPTIDLNDYVVFETTGSSPDGELKVSIDWDKLNEEHGDEVKYTLLSRIMDRDAISDQEAMDLLKNSVSVEAGKTTGISSGDKISYQYIIDEDAIDLLHVSLERQRGTYTVGQMEHYLSSRDELDENTLAAVKEKAESVFSEYRSSWAESSTLVQFIYVGNSLNVSNTGHNELDVVYAVQVRNTAEDETYVYDETKQFFWVAKVNDLEVSTDGTVNADLSNCTYVQDEYVIECEELGRQWYFYGYESLDAYKKKYLNDPVNYTYDTIVSDNDLPSLPQSSSKSLESGSSSANEVIGTVKVKVSNLNIRESASKSSESKGHAEEGKTYKVYEKKTEEGYTWYRIGKDKWIADNGEWVTYKEESNA